MPSVTSSEAGSGGTSSLFPVVKIAFFLAALPLVALDFRFRHAPSSCFGVRLLTPKLQI